MNYNETFSLRWIATGFHLLAGILIWREPNCAKTTGLQFVHGLVGGLDVPIYLLIAGASLVSLWKEDFKKPIYKVLLIVPQQFVLMLSGWGEGVAVWQGKYPNGHIPEGGSLFIGIDQYWALSIMAVHLANVMWLWYVSSKT